MYLSIITSIVKVRSNNSIIFRIVYSTSRRSRPVIRSIFMLLYSLEMVGRQCFPHSIRIRSLFECLNNIQMRAQDLYIAAKPVINIIVNFSKYFHFSDTQRSLPKSLFVIYSMLRRARRKRYIM